MVSDIKKRELRDSIKAIAMDIGKEVAHHIETMYPKAVEATPLTFLLSVRNTTCNRIMAMFDPDNDREVNATLKNNEKVRRHLRKLYKRMRE